MGLLTACYINNVDLSRLGLTIENVEGWDDGLSVSDRLTQLPQRAGSVILAPEAETAPRTITINGVLRKPSMSAVRRAADELKDLLYRGTLEVGFVDRLDRVVYARTQSHATVIVPPQFSNPYSRVRLGLLCPDPLIYARLGTTLGIYSGQQACPLGTAISAPTIRIMGPATNPSITYRRTDGTIRRTMSFNVTLSGSDYLEINCELNDVRKYSAGVLTSALNSWVGDDWIELDPQDGDYAYASWPTLSLSSGTGEVLYRKAYI